MSNEKKIVLVTKSNKIVNETSKVIFVNTDLWKAADLLERRKAAEALWPYLDQLPEWFKHSVYAAVEQWNYENYHY